MRSRHHKYNLCIIVSYFIMYNYKLLYYVLKKEVLKPKPDIIKLKITTLLKINKNNIVFCNNI